MNYKDAYEFEDLPNETGAQFYEGHEADAPWRAEAADRIDQLRKADFTVDVMDSNGNPVENGAVNIKMLRHKFDFGTAVTASRLAGNNAHNVIYESKLKNLDGNGRGFNTVVFENDLKWDGWEEEWFVDKDELVNAVQWLRGNGFKIRGHNLVWPGNQYLPDDIPANLNNLTYVKNRIDEHLEEILNYPGIAGEIYEWDVLNEVVANTDLANAFQGSAGYPTGRELYVDIFNKAREIDSETGLWLNDYITISVGNTAGDTQYDQLKQYTQELIDAGVDIEGIGFQGHIGGSPNGISSVLATYDDFYNSFGLKAKITEFDMPSFVSEELGATYLRDFLTLTYSHPSMDGFLFWNFWDNATWLNGGTNFYRSDWSETPAKHAFTDLLFNEWWTEETLASSNLGIADSRVFKGIYEISYECDGNIIRDTIDIYEDLSYSITCDNMSTDVKEIDKKSFKIYPNPSQGMIQIEQEKNMLTDIRILDLSGKTVFQTEMHSTDFSLDMESLKGTFLLELKNKNAVLTERILIK